MHRSLFFPIFLSLLSLGVCAETTLHEKEFNTIKQAAGMVDGDIVYVDFWASWCNPCRKSFPWMNDMVDRYGAQGFKVLAINVDKDRALANKFLANINATFPIYYDPEGQFAKLFQLKGMPSSFVLDDKGQVLQAHKGFFVDRVDAYEDDIQSLLQR